MTGQITINGEMRPLGDARTLEALLGTIGIDPRKVAVELNLEIVPRSAYGQTQVGPGDRLEIVHFIGGGADDLGLVDPDPLEVAGRTYHSRLLVGTGK
jgi:thiazole synthase